MLLFADIYIFAQIAQGSNPDTNTFRVMIGILLASGDLLYLVLLPMQIIKKHSEIIYQKGGVRFWQAGTCYGVFLMLCNVGTYFYSNTLANSVVYLIKMS